MEESVNNKTNDNNRNETDTSIDNTKIEKEPAQISHPKL